MRCSVMDIDEVIFHAKLYGGEIHRITATVRLEIAHAYSLTLTKVTGLFPYINTLFPSFVCTSVGIHRAGI